MAQETILQSEFLTATLKWADSNADMRLILTMLECSIIAEHHMLTDGMSLLIQAILFRTLEVIEQFRKHGFKDI